jgi:hypothetical protein
MGKVKLICKACGKENEREEKPAPKTRGETRQIYFNCTCGAKTLRDGTCIYLKGQQPPATPPVPPALPPEPPATPPVQPKPRKERKSHAKEENHEPETTTTAEPAESESGFFF